MNTVDSTSGNTQVNHDGLFLTTDEFASLLFQLKAIEKSFKKEKRKGGGEGEREQHVQRKKKRRRRGGERATCTKETVLPNDNALPSIISNFSFDVKKSQLSPSIHTTSFKQD